MRKILVTAFAAIATVSVFANNFMPVSAPSPGVEIGHLDTSAIPAAAEQPEPFTKMNWAAELAPAAIPPTIAAIPEAPVEETPGQQAPEAPTVIEHELTASAPVKSVFQRASMHRYVSEWLEVPAVVLSKLNVIASPSAEPEVAAVVEQNSPPTETSAPKELTGLIASLAFAPANIYEGMINFAGPRSPSGIWAGVADQYLATTPLEEISELAAVTQPVAPQAIEPSGSHLAIGDMTTSPVLPQAPLDLSGRELIAATEGAAPELKQLNKSDLTLGNSIATVVLPEAPREIAVPAQPEPNRNSGYFPMFVAAVFEAPLSVYETLIGTGETAEIKNAVPTVEIVKETPALPEFKTETLLSTGNTTLGASIASVTLPKQPANLNASLLSSPGLLNTVETAAAVETNFELPLFTSSLAVSSHTISDHVANPIGPMTPLASTALPSNYLSLLNSDDRTRTFNTKVTEPVIPQAPVLISQNNEFSNSMLRPMNSSPMFEDKTPAMADKDAFLDRVITSPVTAPRAAADTSVLITGSNEMSLDLLKPMRSTPVVANAAKTNVFSTSVAPAVQDGSFCDPSFVGPPIRFTQTVELTLDDLIRQLHSRFGVNFIMGSNIANLPLSVRAGNIPWNVLLKSQLFVSGVRARCIDANTVELVKNESLSNLQDMADVNTRFVKLTFLQRTSGGTVDLAGRSQGGGQGGQGGCGGNAQGGQSGGGGLSGGGGGGTGQTGETASQQAGSKFDKLIIEIEKILGIRSMTESSVGGGGGQGGGQVGTREGEAVRTNRFVTQIPGRNILAIRATEEEHELIQQIIDRADRPPFQVVIKGLVYSANQDRLTDVGVQTTIFGETGDGRTSGGILLGHTLGSSGTLFDFSTILGTVDFNIQATALQQNGVISVKSRPFAVVLDGLCATLNVGRELPIVIDAPLGGQGDVIFVNAANNLAVAPYVVDDAAGNPMAVTLELRLEANDVDSTISARGVPAISTRSVQTQLLLAEDQTAILGGFTVDQDSRSVSKTPGLGDIPIIGELFKRRIRDTRVNRLYFAISVTVIPFGQPITPVNVPGATTQPPSLTPEQLKRGKEAPSVTGP